MIGLSSYRSWSPELSRSVLQKASASSSAYVHPHSPLPRRHRPGGEGIHDWGPSASEHWDNPQHMLSPSWGKQWPWRRRRHRNIYVLNSGLAAKEVKRPTSLAQRVGRHTVYPGRCAGEHFTKMIGDMLRPGCTTFNTVQSIHTHLGSEGLTPLPSPTNLSDMIKMCIKCLPPLLPAKAPNLICEQGSLVPVRFNFSKPQARRSHQMAEGRRSVHKTRVGAQPHQQIPRSRPGGQGRFRIRSLTQGFSSAHILESTSEE